MSQSIKITHRFTGATLYQCALPDEIAAMSYGRQLGYATREAVKARVNLARANLADAYLARANLAGANLADADLAGAYLAGAYLAGAYLARANLARAKLAGAYLAGAYLARANLADADLARAYLADADLAGAYLAGAYLAGADLADANLGGARNAPTEASRIDPPEPYEHKPAPERYAARAQRFRERNPDVPVIENLDAKILGIIESGTGALEMCRWHTCETTHCMAGWAIHLAGKAGAALEERVGPAIAGRRLWIAATGRAPHFYATNERALEDLRERAAAVVS